MLRELKISTSQAIIHREQEFQDGYCQVKYELVGNKEWFNISWESVGNNETTASDRDRIAYFLCQLPDTEMLKNFGSFDLTRLFVDIKNHQIRLAKWFLFYPEEPLLWELEEGIISQDDYDGFRWATLDLLNWWVLLTEKWSIIKKGFEDFGWDCPFNHPRTLFEEIQSTDNNRAFEKYFLPRYENNPKDLKNLATLLRKEYRGEINLSNDREHKQLGKLVKKVNPTLFTNPWEERVKKVCFSLIDSDHFIKDFLYYDRYLFDAMCRLQQRITCSNTIQAETWIDGVKHSGTWQITAQGKIQPARRVNKT